MGIPFGGIAFFDSGIGGLTVLSECEKALRGENLYYYGDNTHAPYGNLPFEQIRSYVKRAFDTFARLRVKAAVVACNTVTALLIEELREKYPFPIIGTEPAVLQAAKRGGDVFVLTTRATYESERLKILCTRAKEEYPSCTVRAFACDKLAGEIERGLLDSARTYSQFLPNGTPRGVVLGCTHYIYIKKYIESFYGCPSYDGNKGIAARLAQIIAGDIAKNLFFLTTNPSCFDKNRDEKPLLSNFSPKTQEKQTFFRIKQTEVNNANKCSCYVFKKDRKNLIKTQYNQIYFLTKTGQKNREIYKQMFVL